MAQTQEYEFGEAQNAVFRELSQKMTHIAGFLLALGVLYLTAGLLGNTLLNKVGSLLEPSFLATYNVQDHARSLLLSCFIATVVFFCTAFWMRGASNRFQNIVETEGHDIELLMSAMRALKRLYRLWSIVLSAGMAMGLILLVRTLFERA